MVSKMPSYYEHNEKVDMLGVLRGIRESIAKCALAIYGIETATSSLRNVLNMYKETGRLEMSVDVVENYLETISSLLNIVLNDKRCKIIINEVTRAIEKKM